MTYATLSKKAATVRLRIIFCAVKMRRRHEEGFSNTTCLVNIPVHLYSLRQRGKLNIK